MSERLSEKIETGDIVDVHWVNGFDSESEVLNLPRGEGDLIHVKHKDGRVEAINPYGKNFISLVRVPVKS